MASMLLALFVSIVLTMLIVRHASTRSRMVDHDLTGPQKFHVVPVPRVGGLGIVAGLIAAVIHQSLVGAPSGSELGLILMVGVIPACGLGLAGALTKQVSARVRLLATAASAVLAFWLLDAQLRHTAIPGLDLIVSFTVGALVVTVFAVAGIANAMNIIDGFNGLASMCAVIMLAGLAYVAFQVGDPLLGTLAVAGIGAVLGFFIWNFPAGLVFLGDGGAYFLGFYIAELSVLLLARNPAVSPMFPLLLCIYPVFETVFSMYRRRFLRQQPPSMPDGIHLHSLIYRRVMRWAVGPKTARAMARRNSMTSPYLWLLCTSSVVPAVLFWRQTAVLVGCLVVFALAYIVLYWRIVRFKSPRWLRFGRSRALWPDATREQEV